MTVLRFTPHALMEMARRGLSQTLVERAVSEPDAVLADGPVRFIHQRTESDETTGRRWLTRVVVEPEPDGLAIITAYRTSKLAKYGARP